MRVLLSAGGTAGHVLPALTILKALRTMAPDAPQNVSDKMSASSRGSNANVVEALFVGENEGMERELVMRENVPFAAIQAGALNGVGLARPRAAFSAWRAAPSAPSR